MERDRGRRGSSSSALNYFKKPFSWKLGALKLRRSKSTEAASFPVFDPSTATTFDHENCNFVSFNSELDSAVSQYLSQVTELGYRPTNSGSNLSTFKADWKDSNNSVASVNSRTSERLLAVQFQLDSSQHRNTEDNQAKDHDKIGQGESLGEISREGTPEVSEKHLGNDNSLVNFAVHSISSDSSCAQENYYENGSVSITDEPIYENLDGSSDEVFNKEPLYDTVPRRPQVPPKPESLARTLSQENNINTSTDDYVQNCSSVSEDSQCADDVSGDSLSAESLSDSLSQDIERSSKRRKKKNRENTEESLIADGSETSDLGSSGSEDVASIDEWLNTPPKTSTALRVSLEVKDTASSKPESALELLEGEVLAEVERERSLSVVSSIPGEKNTLVIGDTSEDEDSSVQAINSSIVEVCRSHDEIDEATIIDDVSCSSSDDLNAVPAIRHSVIIELKGSEKESKCYKHELKRSDSLHAPGSESERALRKNKCFKKKSRRMSETGLGVCVGVTHNSTTKSTEFVEIIENPVSNQVIEISEDGSWGLKKNIEGINSNLDNKTDKLREIDAENEGNSEKKSRINVQDEGDKNTENKVIKSSKKVVKLSSGKKKSAAKTSVLKKQKGSMEGADIIAAPPEAFSCDDGLDGVFSASCVALTSEPNSLASSLTNEPNVHESQEETVAEVAKSSDPPIKAKEVLNDIPENEEHKKSGKSNLGSAIMESYDKEMIKKKESLNLPEVSMLDFGQSAFDLELDRKNVIKQMIVKTKKKESWFGRTFSTDGDAAAPKVSAANSVKRSNSMSCVAGSTNKVPLTSKKKEPPKDLQFMNMKNAASKAQPVIDEDDIVFPSFMTDAEITTDKNATVQTSSPIEPIPNIELTIKKLGIDELNSPSPYKLNKHLTTITPFKPPSQNKHSSIRNVKNPLLSDLSPDDLPTATADANPSESIATENSKNEIKVEEAVTNPEALETRVRTPQEEANDIHADTCSELAPQNAELESDDSLKTSTIMAEVPVTPKAKGEVDAASILEQKQSTKQYWENKMAATAAPSEDLGWEPVANVCFRDPNAPLETGNTEDCAPEASAGTDFLPAPPPQFDNTPPASIEETKEKNHKLEQERIISLDDEISVLEREVLGEVVASDIEEDIEEISETRQLIEETVKTNHKYVYGEEGAQEEVTPKISTVVQNRRGDPDRLPTVKSTYNATQGKENVIEAEIRAQQERERELKLEQMKKQQILQQNMQNSNKTELMRHNGASSPHDSDEGFVDPPVERPKLEATAKQTVSVVCSDSGYAHVVTDHDGESVIYDAVAPPKSASPRPLPEAPASSPSPVPPKSAPKSPPAAPVPHTTETKIALEIRELKEREEELRRMREARQGVKKIQNGCSVNAEEHEEDFNEVDIEDTEDRGSSSSREILDDHLTSLTTTTDEGNFSECGDATSSEDKSSSGSNSRIMSPEVPGGEYPRPSRRVTVRPFQADDDDDRLVYTRMKNESVIEREIRIAKERDEAYKKEKGLLNGAPAPSKSTAATTNGVTKHASLRQSVSLSAVANGSNKGTQHQLATSRIQLEIAENGQRERELMSAGKVLTLSEDTVDDKVTRLSDLADLPTAQEVRTKSPTSTSRSSSTHQSPTISPHSTLSNSSRSSNNGLSNGFTNGHHFSGSTMNRLTKSLSTTNLSSPQSSLSSTNTGMRPKGLMEKFIASRGKMTPSAFTSPPPVGGSSGRVVATRPMRVQPKKPVLLRQHSSDSTDGSSSSQLALELRPDVRSGPSPPPPHLYKRVVGAEEKIQEELREMQQREEELKRLRSKNLAARSQPNLLEMSLNEIPFEDDQGSTTAEDETDTATETEDSADTVMRAAVSIPNLVDDISENGSVKKVNRRRSALIAEWENRIQSTAAVDA